MDASALPRPAAPPPLVDRRLSGAALERALTRIGDLPRIPLDRNQVLNVERLADGTFSPLEGFLGAADHASVLAAMRLAGGAPWPLPITLQVDPAVARTLAPGGTVALWNHAEDVPSALLDVEEIYTIDVAAQARAVFGTDDPSHPGVARVLEAPPTALAGPISLVRPSRPLLPGRFVLDPAGARAEIARRGFRTVTGFQTRNLAHKAHERLQKIALELTDGLLIHPLIGWKKPGDLLPEIILEGYEVLLEHYYPRGRVILAGLSTAMWYAGPREAVFHALVRRNFGCTHFIVGRDHAGVGGRYARYAAHALFDAFAPGELGIVPLRLHGPSYCPACTEVVTEATCPHDAEREEISGSRIRDLIRKGEAPPPEIMRPEVSAFLVERARRGAVFVPEPAGA